MTAKEFAPVPGPIWLYKVRFHLKLSYNEARLIGWRLRRTMTFVQFNLRFAADDL